MSGSKMSQEEESNFIIPIAEEVIPEQLKEDRIKNSEPTSSQSQPSGPPKRPKIPFNCGDCGLSEEADYYGRKPPFCRTVVFHENSYICRDPFSPQASNNANFLLLGSNCAVCDEMTCQECSVFYTKRLCAKCSKSASQYLPQQLKINKVNNKD